MTTLNEVYPARQATDLRRPGTRRRLFHGRRAVACFAGSAVVLMPKCVVCVAAYLAIGAGLTGRELCGAGTGGNISATLVAQLGLDPSAAARVFGVMNGLSLVAALGLIVLGLRQLRRRTA